MEQGGISVAATYCNRCGCENSSDRGACVRCLNALQWPAAGNSCGNCGGDNASHASYCFNCGNSLGGSEPADDWRLSTAIGLVLGGAAETISADDGAGDEDYLGGEEDPEAVPDLDFEESAGADDDFDMPAPPALDDAAEPEMFEPAEDMDEEDALEMPPPPPDLDDGDVDSEFASLTPEDDAPPVEEAALADLALELAPPPPPESDDLSVEADEAEPVAFAPPAADEKPADEPAADSDDDEALGGWALDLDDDA